MSEVWKLIKSTDYEVSSLGRVRRSLAAPSRQGTWPGRILCPQRSTRGYFHVSLTVERNVAVTTQVHQLVAEAFLGPCPDGCQINHKDGDKSNNRVRNLEYLHAFRNGLNRGNMKLSPQDVGEAQQMLAAGISRKEISERFDVHVVTIYRRVG